MTEAEFGWPCWSDMKRFDNEDQEKRLALTAEM
jgi:hypothetical protein